MPRRSLAQTSFFEPELVQPGCLKEGTVPWLLGRHRSKLFPPWLFKGWRGEGLTGRNAWPPLVLIALLVLRWSEEGMSRLSSVRRAENDAEWRAAMGLEFGVAPPSEKTLRDFERFMLGRHPDCGLRRYQLLHEHVVRLCRDEGVVGAGAVWTTDSTPMWCYGAVLDTVRLLGDGLRQLGTLWARATRSTLERVAEQWDMPLLLAKSTKGAFRVDWREADARASVVNELAGMVTTAAARVRVELEEVRPGLRRKMLRHCRNLVKVIRDDLESDEYGRLVVKKKVAKGRLVSVTDPEARHGRKTRSRLFNGFKIHIIGDIVSGLIAAITVTQGNAHDAAPAHRLISRAKGLFDEIERVLADTAYGAARLRHVVGRTLGVEMLAPPPPDTAPNRTGGKKAMTFDFERGTVTCANGVTTGDFTIVKHGEYGLPARRYRWPKEACNGCPLRSECRNGRRGGHTLLLHPHEQELQEVRKSWQDPEVRKDYRARSQCERLVNQITRHGGQRARAWGLGAANLQAHLIALRCNLKILAEALAAREQEQQARAA